MELPDWARMVLPTATGSLPLIYSGLRDGLATAVIAFDLRQSDLPLQVAWPILASNLAGELLGIAPTAVEPIAPASPVELPLGPGVVALRITRPDASVTELAPGATGASSVTFVETRQLGVYRVEAIIEPEASPSPGSSPSPSPSPAAFPSASPSAAGASPDPSASVPPSSPEPSDDPGIPVGPEDAPLFFAVDLFSVEESNIAPGDGARLAALGSEPDPEVAEAGVARDEWWPFLVAIALVLLLLEWLVYERDGARRIAAGTRRAMGSLTRTRRRAS